ncbi:hypothetical protein BTN50_0825 [Candidatus Enterovibrio altilux]|uniref:Mobile element protein n=1 Tax=Candidatus Enterovibrio altilux TaxID=1927128 RepID=A0A291B8M3_9GAMM|nr:hypothetical protein BTN50_0825 [Candidatus Enterovibrio luxaltus]
MYFQTYLIVVAMFSLLCISKRIKMINVVFKAENKGTIQYLIIDSMKLKV